MNIFNLKITLFPDICFIPKLFLNLDAIVIRNFSSSLLNVLKRVFLMTFLKI